LYAVELKEVSKHFGSVTAVNRLSLRIADGEFFSLLGPSGCGKTTTLRLIAGFEMPSAGEIFIGGNEQGYLPANRRPVNTVFQHYALFPHMSVAQNVAFGLEMSGVPRREIQRRVGEALEMVHLSGLGNRKPGQLSGGQQQRVALARALVNRPKVLLLDEPLGALDLKLRKAMQVELKALQHQVGITFIYVTHDQEEALTMSDRIGVMHKGSLLQVGSPQEGYEAPQTRFVSDFIGDTNHLDGLVTGLANGEAAVQIRGAQQPVRALTVNGVRLGQQVTVAFRPEKVLLDRQAQPDGNTLAGRVVDVVYTGSSTTYLVRLQDGQQVMARQQNAAVSPQMRFQSGDLVTLSWPVHACKAFAE
jgi:spermidine/putrescine transport system ATP-binding protein